MDKYKINFIFNNEKDINDILINILNKELKKIKHPTKMNDLLNLRSFLYALISYKIRLYPLYQPTK